MLCDQHRLRRLLRGVRKARQRRQSATRQLNNLTRDLERSCERRQRRAAHVPARRYDPSLPINARHEEITTAIREHPVVVVCGETGSGKSTQLPKMCLDVGYGVGGMIGHTQPRRIAAQAISSRLSEELRVPMGQQVGYKIRFTDRTNPRTYVKLMTDGILLAETQSDRFLDQYQLIILDEAHERSLNIDFLIG